MLRGELRLPCFFAVIAPTIDAVGADMGRPAKGHYQVMILSAPSAAEQVVDGGMVGTVMLDAHGSQDAP